MTMHLETKSLPFELRDVDDAGIFTGLGSVFGNVDSYGDIVEKGAFADSLKQRTPRMLWQHDWTQPIGVWKSAAETERGLQMTGRLVMETQKGREAHALLKAGAVDGLSIGFMLPKGGWSEDKDGVRRITKAELMEVSVVTFPANQEALVSGVKSRIQRGELISKRELEAALRDVGFSQKQAKAIVAEGWAGLNQRDADDELRELGESISQLIARMN